MKIICCHSPEEFWGWMCKPAFLRTGLRTGTCGQDTIETVIAPEEVSGFLAHKIEQVRTALSSRRGRC